MTWDDVKVAGLLLLIVAVLALGVSCGVANWRECRKYHPVWYCTQGGK